MKPRALYIAMEALLLSLLLFAAVIGSMKSLRASFVESTLSQADKYLKNENFECKSGVYEVTDESSQTLSLPSFWTWAPISGTPELVSTRIHVTGDCGGSGFVERLEGEDSFMIRSPDIETPPLPGKPFDVSLYQQVSVTTDSNYSLSGFMVSLCGGSASPNDCPEGYYIRKMVGLDPTGGTDPLAESVVWVENRQPHVEVKWVNLWVASKALSSTVTVFIRVHSPFQWHGNHAIVDLFRMVEAPEAELTDLPDAVQITGTVGIPTGTHLVQGAIQEIRWTGSLSPDIEAIEGETYELIFDVQYRNISDDKWTLLVESASNDGCIRFQAPQVNQTYLMRVKATAARPTTGGHRYASTWSTPVALHFLPGSNRIRENSERQARTYLPVFRSVLLQNCD